MREKKVGAAVVMNDLGQFLLTWNSRWNCYAFPMKDVEPDQDVLPPTAIRALEDDLGRRLPHARAEALGYVGKFGYSGSTAEDTLYEHWAYDVSPGEVLTLPTGGGQLPRWVSYDDLAAGPDVGWSTKEVARAFVEDQEVALAVATRLTATETEYLLTWNDNYGGLFFPAMRIKQELKPEATARAVVRSDLGYRGGVVVRCLGEVPEAHYSTRFGRERAYRFHVCLVSLPDLDLNQPLSLLERRMRARGLQWRWLTASQLLNPTDPSSPTLEAVRATVVQLIPPVKRDRLIRQSEGGVALIRRNVAGQTEWLAQWNDNWKAFFFVGGHRQEAETFRECVIRETAEELGLTPSVDFDVALRPVANLQYVAYSQSAGTDTAYTMQPFEVRLLRAQAFQQVEADPKNRWLTTQEIFRQEAFDGRPVSVTVPMLLTQAGLLTC
jgi:8-oxo-dGTP pyrophosphatase MutT (NUDIX family)